MNVDLREYFDALLGEYRRGHDRQHEAEALAWVTFKEMWQREREEALATIGARLDTLNELRGEVLTDRGDFVQKAWFEARRELLEARISSLEAWRSKAIGASVVMMALSGGLGSLVTRLIGR